MWWSRYEWCERSYHPGQSYLYLQWRERRLQREFINSLNLGPLISAFNVFSHLYISTYMTVYKRAICPKLSLLYSFWLKFHIHFRSLEVADLGSRTILTLWSLNSPLSSSFTTSRELLSQFLTCQGRIQGGKRTGSQKDKKGTIF